MRERILVAFVWTKPGSASVSFNDVSIYFPPGVQKPSFIAGLAKDAAAHITSDTSINGPLTAAFMGAQVTTAQLIKTTQGGFVYDF